MTCSCATATKNERLNVRRTRDTSISAPRRFERLKKEPGSLELTPGGWVEVLPNDDAVPVDGDGIDNDPENI
jgi:hypothetical protein